ncbi:MAG: putative toxin-antitoxin system toxin component, PIN family [Oscillospiraceae bacterium]|jgi:putative PIN family toxin of toxin-antitoxin system|nr:putative toxin-antitoxin system toxin component, PIN family [Oscillospiraceae bacterium]
MKCIIDTNVLVSASLFPGSVPALAYRKAVSFPNYGMVCDYSVDEMRRVYHRKFPDKLWQMDAFLSTMLLSVTIISTPPEEESVADEAAIRDIKDRPILRAAIKSDADVLITGDRDFLESGLVHPVLIKPAAFLNLA